MRNLKRILALAAAAIIFAGAVLHPSVHPVQAQEPAAEWCGAKGSCSTDAPVPSNTAKAVAAEKTPPKDEQSFTLAIMYMNDSHAHVDQYPRLFSAVKQVRNHKEHTLLVHAGDVFSGTLYFLKYAANADLFFLNRLGPDAMALGNHEFDKGSRPLASFVKKARFPLVSANVQLKADRFLAPLAANQIGTSCEGGKIFPAIVKEYNGERVAIVGLTTPDTKILSNPGEETVFEKPAAKAQEIIEQLTAAGINKIIVLSHLGYQEDVKLAKTVKGIDVIIGGHSHTVLHQPEVIGKEEPVLIVQAGDHLKYLGLLEVAFNMNGIITGHNGQLLSLASYPEDRDTAERLFQYKTPVEELMKKAVGNSEVFLNGERDEIRRMETNLGNLIADAFLEKANEYIKTDIAMINSGEIRTSIPAGEITFGQLVSVLPFQNNLIVLSMSGEEIWQALENSVSDVESGKGKFAQVSGLKFKYDVNRPPGKRVWAVEVKTGKSFEPLDLNKYYSVVTTNFIADGRTGYHMFKKAREEGRVKELYIKDFEALKTYLEKHRPVTPQVEGRIVRAAEKK